MAKNNNLTDFLTDVANAIRAKKGTSALIDPQDFSDEIASISGGGGDDGQGKYKVQFIDIDGTILKTKYVNSGDRVTPPEDPSYDSDYLEFNDWVISGDGNLNNVTQDILAMPYYIPKYNTTLYERSTYLFCYFDTNLTPELYFTEWGSGPSDTCVDWGDGSPVEIVTSNTISHTYANSGLYIIAVSGRYTLGTTSAAGIFTSTNYQYSLLKAYCSQYCIFYNCQALSIVVLPPAKSKVYTDWTIPDSVLWFAKSLENLVIPDDYKYINENAFRYCYGLKNLVIPGSVVRLSSNCLSSCLNLKSLVVSNSITQTFNPGVDYLSYNLETLYIPTTQNGMSNANFSWALKNLTLGANYNFAINLSKCLDLSKESLINIANNLKDNTGLTAKTITFNNSKKAILNLVYLNSNGEEVSAGTTGANNLLTIITNKNWTVSYSSPNPG